MDGRRFELEAKEAGIIQRERKLPGVRTSYLITSRDASSGDVMMAAGIDGDMYLFYACTSPQVWLRKAPISDS